MRRTGGTERFDEQIGLIAALGEPIRRALYRYVVAQPEPVGREQAASAIGVARHVAKFHLDKLEADGLLETEYSRPPGRGGPGAGRPAKRYRRAARDVSVSLPERRYDLAGRVMAQAIAAATDSGTPIADALHEAATVEGRDMGDLVQARLGEDPDQATRTRVVSDLLSEQGYEPRITDDVITLVNCPFHSLAREHTDLVCGMNLDLIRGLLATCDGSGLHARLDPVPGQCCVKLDRGRSTQSRRKATGR